MICRKGIEVEGKLVPCGRCLNCRINRQRDWTSRILMEQVTHQGPAYFVTLTYDDNEVPKTIDHVCTLRKSAFTKWVENSRLRSGAFRYYAVGEYGDRTMRPHYHMAIFPRSDSQAADLVDGWKKGFTSSTELSPQRAAYLAQYTTKKLTSHSDERLEAGQEPEFRSGSRRPPLGAAFVPHLVRAYRTSGGQSVLEQRGDIERSWRFGGKIYPIPRAIADRARLDLGIPQLHSERLSHPGYYAAHCEEDHATWEPTVAIAEEMKFHAKKSANSLRYQTINV